MNAPFKNFPTPRDYPRAANAGGAGSPPPVSPATHSNTAERLVKSTRDLPPSRPIRSQSPVGGEGRDVTANVGSVGIPFVCHRDQARQAHFPRQWKASDVSRVIALYRRGLTYGQIAIRFGVTRCAIAGVIHRHSQGAKGRAAA